MMRSIILGLLFLLFIPLTLFSTDDLNVTITQFEVNNLPQFSLYISITDRFGNPVKLNQESIITENNLIELFEDQQQVTIHDIKPVLDLMDSEISRFYIVLVMDNSQSMKPFLNDTKMAADQFIDRVRNDDKIAVVIFGKSDITKIEARITQDFTNIKQILKNRTYPKHLTSRTYLFDAIYTACMRLKDEKTIGRKAIVVLSDGQDIGSKTSSTTVIKMAQEEDIPIYAIDFQRQSINKTLRRISEKTNGKYFRSESVQQIAYLYDAILEQLQGQYRITYTSQNENWAQPSRQMSVNIRHKQNLISGSRTYYPDVARLQYLALRYKEALLKVSSDDYLNYINNYSNSEWCDDIQFRLGVHYEQRGHYEKAQQIYDELISNPQTEWKDDVLFRKGKIYENTGEFAKAVEVYENVINNYPDAKTAPDAMLGMARSYRETDDFIKAEQAYVKIKDNYSSSEITDEALLELSSLKISQKQYNEAKTLLLELVDKYKESNSTPQAFLNLANLSKTEGNLAEAVQYCDQAGKHSKDSEFISNSYAFKGDLLYKMGDYNRAIEAYEMVVNNYQDQGYDDEALLGLAQSYRETSQYTNMKQSYESIQQMRANNEDVSFDLNEVNTVTRVIPPNQIEKVTTLSGAYFETIPAQEITFPIEVSIKPVPTPDQFKNFAIAGNIYDISVSADTLFAPVRIALPYEQGWIDSSKNVEDFKLYTYEDTKWTPIPNCQADTIQKVICAEVTKLSLKAIMFKTPKVIRFEDILFDFNSADLTLEAKVKVDTVVSILKESDQIRLEVQGHTDSIGTSEINFELSQKRANTIKKFLVESGVDSIRIIAIGYGEDFPIANNASEQGRALNRRTEFVIISKGENDIIDVQQRQLGTKYTIQLGDGFTILSKAVELSEIFKKEGFDVTIKHAMIDEQPIYKIWCGYFDNEGEAKDFAETIVAQFINFNYTIIER